MELLDFRGVRVLVTGGAGFIGSHLVDALLERGAQVRVLDNFATGRRENLGHCMDRVELFEADIRNAADCRRACQGTELVFHQAALGSVPRSVADPATSLAVNAGGTANVFAGARDEGVRRVIYASSSSVYGDSDVLPKREGQEGRPLSPYALSKKMNEEVAELFGRCYGLEFFGLRYFNVYGPRQDPDGPYAAVIPRFFKASFAKEAAVIYGDGEQSRDFTFVLDAVRANLLAAAAPSSGSGAVYNIAGGRQTTVNELIAAVRSVVDEVPPPRHEPPRSGDVLHSVADGTLALRALKYAPEIDLGEGLKRSREHYSGVAKPARREEGVGSGKG